MTAYLTGFADFTGSFIFGQEAKQAGTSSSGGRKVLKEEIVMIHTLEEERKNETIF